MFHHATRKWGLADALRRVGLFRNCTDRELGQVMRLVTSLDVSAGRVLTRQGAVGEECFVIVRGDATVARGGVVTAQVHDGDLVGELALLDHVPRTATITTNRPAHLLVMSQREFRGLRDLGIASVTRHVDATAAAHRSAVQSQRCQPTGLLALLDA